VELKVALRAESYSSRGSEFKVESCSSLSSELNPQGGYLSDCWWKQEFDGWEAYKKSKPIIYSDLRSSIVSFSFSDTNVTENVTEKREYQILKILQSNQTITTNELAEKYNVSRRTIASDIENIKTSLALQCCTKQEISNSLTKQNCNM
jgi:hypothetical protein